VSDQELKELVASIAIAQKDTDRQLKENAVAQKETDRQLKELGKQIGGLGNKFGDFAEGMAIPSLVEILSKRFRAEQIIETRWMRKHGQEIELDLIGASNGENKIVAVAEVKSYLNQRELDKFLRNLSSFFFFFPQFKGYKLYGVIAATDSSEEMEKTALAQGVAVARMSDDVFRLKEPPGFTPKNFADA
jgi:hypothetical protein